MKLYPHTHTHTHTYTQRRERERERETERERERERERESYLCMLICTEGGFRPLCAAIQRLSIHFIIEEMKEMY